MAKYRKKPVEIEAEQWHPGKEIDGVNEVPIELIFSADGNWYYLNLLTLDHLSEHPLVWLSVKEEDERTLPFALYEIKARERREAKDDDPLVSRYLKLYGLATLPKNDIGHINTLKGWRVVEGGDWIITGVQGEKYSCKPDIFEQDYEPVTLD